VARECVCVCGWRRFGANGGVKLYLLKLAGSALHSAQAPNVSILINFVSLRLAPVSDAALSREYSVARECVCVCGVRRSWRRILTASQSLEYSVEMS